MKEIRFLPAARAEFAETAAEYAKENRTLGSEFLTNIERATQRIGTFPEHGSPYLADTRRVLLQRFPFSIVYRSESDACIVIAFPHHRRRPGYWHERINER